VSDDPALQSSVGVEMKGSGEVSGLIDVLFRKMRKCKLLENSWVQWSLC
jgi:hypothetical protein